MTRPGRSPPAGCDAGRPARAPSTFCGDALRLSCCVWTGVSRFGLLRGCARGPIGFGPSRPSRRRPSTSPAVIVRARQTVDDRVPTLTGFVPFPVTPTAASARTMSRQLMPRCSAASNHHRCSATRRASFFRAPPGRWKSSAMAFSPASSSLLLTISISHMPERIGVQLSFCKSLQSYAFRFRKMQKIAELTPVHLWMAPCPCRKPNLAGG